MKKLLKLLTAIQLSVIMLSFTAQKAQAQPGVSVSYQSFYDNLSPYGQWVSDPQYGNVFVPQEGADFRPYYSRGHWAMTDYGNTWVSDDPWGWACYHYGRWTYDPYYGWVWVPGNEWAPAWVDWRYGGGQCGWAPLGPGISIGVSSYNCPDNWWVFVGPQYLYNRGGYGNYWRGPDYNRNYINQTTIINNTYVDNSTHVRYNYGPRSAQIQSFTHQPVPVYRVASASAPGAARMNGNAVNLFRPAVNRNTINTARPTNVVRAPQALGHPQAIQANHQPAFGQQIQRQGGINSARNNVNGANRTQTQTMPNNRIGQLNQQNNRAAGSMPQRTNTPFNNQAINRGQQNTNRTQVQPINRTPAQTFNNTQRIQSQQNRGAQQSQFNQAQMPQQNRITQQPQTQRQAPQQQANRFQQQTQRQAPQQPQINRVQPQQQPQRQMQQPQQFNRVQQQPQVQQRQAAPQMQQRMEAPRQQAAPQQHTEAPRAAPGGGGHFEGGRR